MLPMICGSCGTILGNKQTIYEEKIEKLVTKLGIDYNLEYNEEYISERKKIINDLCKRWCCKKDLMTYIDIVKIIN